MKNERTMRLINRLIAPSTIFLFVLIYYFEVSDLSDGNLLLIRPIFWVMVVLYPAVLLIEIKKWKNTDFSQLEKTSDDDETEFDENYEINSKVTPKLLIYITSIALYLILLPYLGFILVSLIFLPSLLFVFGTKDIKLLIAIPVIVTLVIYLLFDTWLGIPLPKGFFG
ncbi:tripartite tricarboxylate transporter TctB family protein [Bacillaceae bacterium W0354]